MADRRGYWEQSTIYYDTVCAGCRDACERKSPRACCSLHRPEPVGIGAATAQCPPRASVANRSEDAARNMVESAAATSQVMMH